jgi:hypothetical protein
VTDHQKLILFLSIVAAMELVTIWLMARTCIERKNKIYDLQTALWRYGKHDPDCLDYSLPEWGKVNDHCSCEWSNTRRLIA